MPHHIKVDEETWEVTFSGESTPTGAHALLFHCETNASKPYRVVEVPADRVPDAEAAANLSDAVLRHLFSQADPMGVTRDPAADPDHPGGHPIG